MKFTVALLVPLFLVVSQARAVPTKSASALLAMPSSSVPGSRPDGSLTALQPKSVEGDVSTLNCSRSTSLATADLCVQRRMAAAAESGLLWQGAQFWLSLFSAVGLGISILYAARAASASSEAAQASIQSLRLSQRGFVAVKTFLIHRSTWALSTGETVQGVSVVPVIGNMGSAPALITSIVWSTRTKMHGDQSPFEFPQDPSDQKLKILVGPGVEITDRAREVNLLTLRKIYSQEIRVVFSFRHDYADLFDASKSYHSFSCFELKVVADPDVVYGSELIEPSRFIHLEARGEFGSAS